MDVREERLALLPRDAAELDPALPFAVYFAVNEAVQGGLPHNAVSLPVVLR